MHRVISSILFSLATTVLDAKPLLVLGGEHEDHSRIVIYLDQPRQFDVKRQAREISVSIDQHSDGFSTKNLFDRLSSGRIRSAKNTLNVLELDLGCSCEYQARLENSLLILDIYDVKDKKYEALIFGELDGNDMQGFPLGPRFTLFPESDRSVVEKTNGTHIGRSAHEYMWRRVFQRTLDNSNEIAANNEASTIEENFNTDDITSRLPVNETSEKYEKFLKSPNISITVDPLLSVDMSSDLQDVNCPENSLVDVNTWSNGGNILEELSSLRRLTVNSTGGLNQEAIELSVQKLLASGFAQEAKQLSSEIVSLPTREVYAFLSDLIISEKIVTPPPKWRWKDCESFAHLWYMISGNATTVQSTKSVNLALRQYSSLSEHIRRLLLSRISIQEWVTADQNIVKQINHMQSRPRPLTEAAESERRVQVLDYSSIDFQAKRHIMKIVKDFGDVSDVSNADIELMRYYTYLLGKKNESEEYKMANVLLGFFDKNYEGMESGISDLLKTNGLSASIFFDSILVNILHKEDSYEFLSLLVPLTELVVAHADFERSKQLGDRAARLGFPFSWKSSSTSNVEEIEDMASVPFIETGGEEIEDEHIKSEGAFSTHVEIMKDSRILKKDVRSFLSSSN